MTEIIDTHPDINVNESEYIRLLGFPKNYNLENRTRDLADWARQWYSENGKPWIYAVTVDDVDVTNNRIIIDDIEILSKKLYNKFSEAEVDKAIIVAVSAGKECEEKSHQLWLEEKPDEYFFLEVYGSAVVEHLITTTGFRFCDWAEKNNLAVLPHYSPGYSGWRIEDQENILKLIQRNKINELPGEIELFETGMLNPKKSMLALFGITKNVSKVRNLREFIPCESCSLSYCPYRRVPFKNPRTQIEEIGKLQFSEKHTNNGNYKNLLSQDAKYSVSHKALKKWSEERLQLHILNDMSVEAKFNYEGTTCSNMGRKLRFDYNVKLSSPYDGYKIEGMNCSPSVDDDGYMFMCEYLKDPDVLMDKIKSEKPLLGESLNEIINWKREFNPEGCYCNHESRKHKWGLVLEVIHYSLAKRFKEENITLNLFQGLEEIGNGKYF